MPTELGYLTVPVPDVPRAKAFFGILFGWTFEGGDPNAAHIPNTRLPMGFSTGGPVDYSGLYFQVTDLRAMSAKVAELGGQAGDAVQSESGLSAVCHDDQGTAFGLWQPAPGFAG
jgi:predicted enzyme related to lactoylglutathione lyase